MNLVKVISFYVCAFVLVGCSSKQYVAYEVPVVYKLSRPTRPIMKDNQNTIKYLLEVLEYTKTLEAIIDNHNKTKNEE